ncbi:MAG TPA: hypothetical protein VE987_19415 [Polyangiaceae bacterium]|nr:hypothetical protein [Polyangiaceae bacterium]
MLAWWSKRLVTGALALAASCSSPEQPRGEGGQCFVVSDCRAPLVCLQQPDGTRRCSSQASLTSGQDGGGAVPADAAGLD